MVGGFAVTMHSYTRTTADIDIWVKEEIENRKNLGKTMEVFGYKDLSWEEIQFVPGWNNFYIGNGIMLDVLINMKGLEGYTFDECLKMSKGLQK